MVTIGMGILILIVAICFLAGMTMTVILFSKMMGS